MSKAMRPKFLVDQLRLLNRDARLSFQIHKHISNPIICLTLFAYFFSTFVEREIGQFEFDTLLLRLGSATAILPLLFKHFWPQWLLRYGHLYWCTMVGIMLPYCFGLILALNTLDDKPVVVLNNIAMTEYVLATFFLVQILFSLRLILFVWLVSTLLAFTSIYLFSETAHTSLLRTLAYVFPFILTILLGGSIINRSLFNFQREKEQAVRNVANAIAHQLRTPLATIRNMTDGTTIHLSTITKGYQKAVQNHLVDDALSNEKILALENALESVNKEASHANGLIDILIANSRPFELLNTNSKTIDMVRLLKSAIASYPYNNKREKDLICLQTDINFEVVGSEQLLTHTIYNLIANSIEFSQKSLVAEIKIWVEVVSKWNLVHIWDNGPGIPRKHIHQIYDPFFSHNSVNGTGIGLSFCKSVLEGIGGRIECASEEGEYCQFTLFFPKTRRNSSLNKEHHDLSS